MLSRLAGVNSSVFEKLQLNLGTYDILEGCGVLCQLEADRLLTAFSSQQ